MVFLPATRITELWLFGVVRPKGSKKWRKNFWRAVEMCAVGVVARYGGNAFARFLSIIGGLCCVPIAFIYPAFFHLRICAKSTCEKILDWLLIALGSLAGAFVLGQVLLSGR